MMRRIGSLATLLLVALHSPAAAQKPGTVEFGVFGRYTRFDQALHFDKRPGIGARLGVFVLPNLSLEGDASYTATAAQGGEFIRYIPLHGRLIYNVPLGEHTAFLIGGGYVRNLFRSSYRETNSGGGGLLGFRLGLGDVLSIRLDGTGDYIPTAESDHVPAQLAGIVHKKSNFHLGFQGGLSFLLGGKRDGDHDRDGVKNSLDQCPDTPAGDRVDAKGCTVPKDADGDGVLDAADKCPNTPAGTAVDATGCPKDSDGDGVLDAADKCPNTPAGTAVDASGCPRDSDKDGVIDTLDKCPNTPAGTAVDATGCPSDSDHDGVLDAADKCPNTPAGTTVDAVGCPALFGTGASLVLQGVNFQTGKAVLLPESQTILDRVAESLNNNPTVTVEVGGHTDNTGRKATNLRLSQARASAVRDYLISKGVDGGRITAKGYGPDQPVADNATAAGRAANRRVELSKTN